MLTHLNSALSNAGSSTLNVLTRLYPSIWGWLLLASVVYFFSLRNFWPNTSFLNWNSFCFSVTTRSGTSSRALCRLTKEHSWRAPFAVSTFFFQPKRSWRGLLSLSYRRWICLLVVIKSGDDWEQNEKNCIKVYSICHSLKLFFLLVKMPQPDSPGTFMSAAVRGRESRSHAVGEALSSCPPEICELSAQEMV